MVFGSHRLIISTFQVFAIDCIILGTSVFRGKSIPNCVLLCMGDCGHSRITSGDTTCILVCYIVDGILCGVVGGIYFYGISNTTGDHPVHKKALDGGDMGFFVKEVYLACGVMGLFAVGLLLCGTIAATTIEVRAAEDRGQLEPLVTASASRWSLPAASAQRPAPSAGAEQMKYPVV